MAKASDLQKEVDRWKDKYFEQGDSYDAQNTITNSYLAILQRLLVRVSLAAENTSEALDNELSSLRSAIRSASPANNDLDKRLKRLDAIILSSDESKQQNNNNMLAGIAKLVEQLLSLKIQRKQKNALRKLAKELEKNNNNNTQGCTEVLLQFVELQKQVLDNLSEETIKEPGFLDRIFGSNSSQEMTSVSTPEVIIPESSATTKRDQIAPLEEQNLELGLEILHKNDDEVAPGFTSIAKHIRETIVNLLDQLEFPASAQREVAKMRDQIEKEIIWYELGPTLDDLANLVLSVVGKGQREFEGFLKQLDERLGKVQEFLSESHKVEQRWQDHNTNFDKGMRDQVSQMSKTVDEAGDLGLLKRSISEHLDKISSAVDQHSNVGLEYNEEKESELKTLQERIKAMEQETIEIRKRLKEERSKALRDSLTGLPNREAYDERIELELERWKRYKKPSTLVVADIDFFKKVNDNYGHLSGDKVLQIMAKEVQNRIRKTDFVARYGGEEFVIILPETELGIAQQVIEKTREMIGRLPFHFKNENVQISMSFGLVMFEEGCDQAMLFERADKALYLAKEKGRNRVEVWQDSERS